MFDSDLWIVNNIFSKSLITFCYLKIHPNVLTILSLIMSLSLPIFHQMGQYALVMILIFIRQLLDLLDGPVARECNKTSKIGGMLDTIADYALLCSLVFILCYKYLGNNYLSFIISLITLMFAINVTIYLYGVSSIYDHSKIKDGISVHSIVANHSIIISILIIIAYYFIFVKK